MFMKRVGWAGWILGLLAVSTAGTVRSAESGGMKIAAMTFNVRYATSKDGVDRWEFRKEMVVDEIRKSRSDLVGLQEERQPQVDYLKGNLPEFDFVSFYRDGKSGGPANSILYRESRFELNDSGVFWLSDTPEIPNSKGWGNQGSRFCNWARLIDKQTGQAVYLYNLHLDHESQNARERGAALIAERIAVRRHNDSIILTGDLNSKESNSVIKFFKGAELKIDGKPHRFPEPLVDSFRAKHGSNVNAGTFNGLGRYKKSEFRKIDYVFVPETVQVLDAKVSLYNKDGRYPSDHCPVMAHFRLPAVSGVIDGQAKKKRE